MTGVLFVSAPGTYSFTLNSDDGSQLFIDTVLIVDDGGPHPPAIVSGSRTFPAAGTHRFEVQFFECCGPPSGVDLTLPSGVHYGFAGTVGAPNCHGDSVSSLATQFGGIAAAAGALRFPSVKALQDAIKGYCKG
jgi:PA14 domain